MFVEAIIQNDSPSFLKSFREKMDLLISNKLEEMRYDIIQKEFGFLNERDKPSVGLSVTRSFERHKVNKDQTATLNSNNYKMLNGKLVRMGSIEKFNRNNSKNRASFNSNSHVSHVAIAKRQMTQQRDKALGIDPHQRQKALGFTQKTDRNAKLTNRST